MGTITRIDEFEGIFRRHNSGLSDADERHQWVLQQRVRNWVEMGQQLIAEVNAETVHRKIDQDAYIAFIEDEVIALKDGRCDFSRWDNAIKEARNG